MPVVQELIEAFRFLCIATLSISSKFFDSIYVGSTENGFSSPCQQNPNIRYSCGSARRICWILRLTWLSVNWNPNPTVSSRFPKVVEVLVTPVWCSTVRDVCHQWRGIWLYSLTLTGKGTHRPLGDINFHGTLSFDWPAKAIWSVPDGTWLHVFY